MTENNLFEFETKLFRLRSRQQILKCRLSNELNIVSCVNVIQTFTPNNFAADEEFLRATRTEAKFNAKSISLELDGVNAELERLKKDDPRPCEFPFPTEEST